MRIAICDDNHAFAESFEQTIRSYFKKTTLKNPEIIIYNNGNDLIIDPIVPDIVFLDIEMQGKNGLSVGRHLKGVNNNIIIIIITAFSQYLDDSMDIPVFRYIQKPVDKQRLFNCMDSALKRYHSKVRKIVIETRSHSYTVYSSDIVMVEATEGKVIVSTENKQYISIKKMSYWIDTLNYLPFFNSHRSFIVNFNYISEFDRENIYLCNNSKTAYLTSRLYTQFKKSYLLFLESMKG